MMESESTALPLGYTPISVLSAASSDLYSIPQFQELVKDFLDFFMNFLKILQSMKKPEKQKSTGQTPQC